MTDLERLFEKGMQDGMIQYDSEAFKRQYPTLRRNILKMMQRYANEQLITASNTITGFSRVDDQRRILNLMKKTNR